MWNFFNSGARKGTEAYDVEQQIKKLKKVAEDRGIPKLVAELYFDKIRYFPSWIKKDRLYVPELIESAESVPKSNGRETLFLTIRGTKYRFEFTEHSFSTPDDYVTHGLVEIFTEDKKWFGVNSSCTYHEYGSTWSPFEVTAFIDGAWVRDLTDLKKAINEQDRQRSVQKAEDPIRINQLKKDFGLE